MAAIVHNSSFYIGLAVNAAKRVSASEPEEDGRREAIISVVFAASALEAFINERVDWAVQLCNEQDEPEVVRTFASVLTEAENSRASLESKYKLARWILTGKGYDQGTNPYQDFSLLISLRNSLVHLKPANTLLKRFEGKGVLLPEDQVAFESLDDPSEPMPGSWTERVATKEMAIWACDAASRFVVEFIDSLSRETLGGRFYVQNSHVVRKYWADIWNTSPEVLAMGQER
jgi:hypothetical protein